MLDCLLIGYSGIDKSALEYQNLMKQNKKIDEIPIALNAAISYLGTELDKKELSFDFINSIEGNTEMLINTLHVTETICVGISTTICPSFIQLRKLINLIKASKPKTKIIIGGAVIVFSLREMRKQGVQAINEGMRTIQADYIIDSLYGEDYFAELVYCIKNNKSCDNIPNVLQRKEGIYVEAKAFDDTYILEDRRVNWELFKGRTGGAVAVRTSLSCCFNCSFCSFPVRAGRYKSLPIEYIERELNEIEKLGEVKLVHFIDDTFNVPLKRFKEILQMLIRNKYGFRWHSFIRCQSLDEEAVQLMKESGCIGVFLGLESGNDDVLKAMNKASKVADYKRGIELLKKHDITIVASFFVGFPGETVETAKDTFEFIKLISPAFYFLGTWFYEANTPISQYKTEYELTGMYTNWKHKGMDSETANKLVSQMKGALKGPILLESLSYPFLFQILSWDFGIETVKGYFKNKVRLSSKV